MRKISRTSGLARNAGAYASLTTGVFVSWIAFLAGVGTSAAAAAGSPSQQVVSVRAQVSVTAVAGESWLSHLHRTLGETSMGKTDRLGPAALAPGEDGTASQIKQSSFDPSSTVVLHGSDLYRMNCQGCHRESGLGAPPEIGSVIDPVRATAAAAVMERMRKVGMSVSRAEAAGLAKESQAALLQRLHKGGQEMPAFSHLRDAEVRSLIAYLRQLAGLPDAEKQQIAVRESPVRVGELIVKSTCHTCHSAVGPNPTAEQLLDGAIPPLSTLPVRTSQTQLVRKVTRGAPILMGAPALLCRGRMPVFYYLNNSEAADVYQYLTLYPPNETQTDATAVAMLGDPPANEPKGGEPKLIASAVANDEASSGQRADMEIASLAYAAGFFVIVLLTGGIVVTAHEFKRLPAESARRRVARHKSVRVLQMPTIVLRADLLNSCPDELCAQSEDYHEAGSGL